MIGKIINEIGNDENVFVSTVYDDCSLRSCDTNALILHLFQHNGINMGRDDIKYENFEKGMAYYRNQNVDVMMRNAGGRSVVADAGVINVCLTKKSSGSMTEDYAYFDGFLKSALKSVSQSIDTGEIVGAMCPGTSDLSIRGKKFCGTAQRKRGEVVNVVGYISINGDSQRRSRLIKGFYEATGAHDVVIDDDKMDNLDTLIGQSLTVEAVSNLLIGELVHRCEKVDFKRGYELDSELFLTSYQRIMDHNMRFNEAIES